MANVRLFGLVLIITALFLGMAAVVTQTNRIRIRDFSSNPLPNLPSNTPVIAPGDPTSGSNPNLPPASTDELQFTTIPVFVPLGVAGLLGLMFWFTPAARPTKKPNVKYRRRRRR